MSKMITISKIPRKAENENEKTFAKMVISVFLLVPHHGQSGNA